MRAPRGLRFRGILIAAILALAAEGAAVAQRGGGGGGRGMPGPGQFPGLSSRGNPDTRRGDQPFGTSPPNPRADANGAGSTARGGLQLGPPGRWWDDKHFAKSLQLRSDQQRRMDDIFEQSRSTLLKRYETLQGEEQRMDALTHASPLDENALFSQIDRVAQARADLEKANTHFLYQIRNEMDPDQIARLEQHR